jgi:hypothetical protein
MKFTRFVPEAIQEPLALERPSTDLRVFLTRELRQAIARPDDESGAMELIKMNVWINRSRGLAGRSIYVLESDDFGDFTVPAEHAWHFGEFELIFRRLETLEFVELLGEAIEAGVFGVRRINQLLEADRLGFRFARDSGRKLTVEMRDAEEIEALAKADPHWHENIRLLVARMEQAGTAKDHAALIHASASVFETLAKEVVGIPGVQSNTLKSFFDRYRKDSGLPTAILDYVLDLYDRRNTTPLSGHGSLAPPPQLTESEARTLIEMTKAFVVIEYKLKLSGVSRGAHSPTATTNANPASPAPQPASGATHAAAPGGSAPASSAASTASTVSLGAAKQT